MFTKVLLTVFLISYSSAFPSEPAVESKTTIPIVSQNTDDKGNGSFTFSFETGNGIKLQEEGFVKPLSPSETKNLNAEEGEEIATEAQVIKGSFSYTAPDGTPIELKYSADETGFHPEGSHLPTAPPVPQEIQLALDSLPKSKEENKGQ